jgi:CO/xanthine dehydrogenase FAD-binding subunit
MAQKASGFAICGAAAAVELDASGALSNVAIGITGVGSRAFRAAKTEADLRGQKPAPDILKPACAKAGDGVIALDDIHASADYRLDMACVFARRALDAAIERAL